MNTVKNDIKNGMLKKCYLLYGGEAFIRNLYLKRLKTAAVGEAFPEMNIDIFNGDTDVNKIIDAAETLPFMSEKRLVVVKDSGLFKAGKKDGSEKMSDFVKDIPNSTCMVFVEDEADKRLKLFKAVSKAGHAALCKAPTGNELYRWAENMLSKNKIKMERPQTEYFFKTIGGDMEKAVFELNKLINYKGGQGEILIEDIDAVCAKSLESRIFDLVDAIGTRNTSLAIKIYRNIILNGEQPVGILAMITRQFRIMLEAGVLTASGKSVAEIVNLTNQKDFVIKKALSQSKNFTSEILKKAMSDCLETDYSIKSGLIDGETAVEMLIVKYSK